MAWFDKPKNDYPKSWGEYSLDYRLFMAFEISLLGLLFLGGSLPGLSSEQTRCAIGIWALGLICVATVYRSIRNWRWSGISGRRFVIAVLSVALGAVFLVVFGHGLPRTPSTEIMFVFAVAVVLWNVLHGLGLATASNIEFDEQCGKSNATDAKEQDDAPQEPAWKRRVRALVYLAFIAVWLEAMAFFYFHQEFLKRGSPLPTTTQTEPVTEHGGTVYLTKQDKQVDGWLMGVFMIGIPGAMIAVFLTHFGLGVPVIRNMPESEGWFRKRD